MQTLHVELGERRYPIFIGSDLNPQSLLEPYIHGKQVMIVTNTTVKPLYLDHYVSAIERLGKTVATCILPDGEKYKNIEHLNLIFDALLEAGFNRDATVLALGGGVERHSCSSCVDHLCGRSWHRPVSTASGCRRSPCRKYPAS